VSLYRGGPCPRHGAKDGGRHFSVLRAQLRKDVHEKRLFWAGRCVWDTCSCRSVPRAREQTGADEAACLADRAERDIHAGEPQDLLGCALAFRGRWRGLDAESAADRRERQGLGLRRQPPVGAHFLEPLRQDVKQEPPDELPAGERHRLLRVAVNAVAPRECDLAVPDTEDAVVGDGYAVRVASEVVQRLLRGAGRGLGVHDPLDFPQLPDQGVPGCGLRQRRCRAFELQLVALPQASEPFDEARAEAGGQRVLAEEEAAVCAPPGLRVRVPRPARHKAVEVAVERQPLRPGVQDGDEAEPSAQLPLRV